MQARWPTEHEWKQEAIATAMADRVNRKLGYPEVIFADLLWLVAESDPLERKERYMRTETPKTAHYVAEVGGVRLNRVDGAWEWKTNNGRGSASSIHEAIRQASVVKEAQDA